MKIARKSFQKVRRNKWINRLYVNAQRWTKSSPAICFYIPDKSKGWILEAACREIAQRLEVPYAFCGDHKLLPWANAYFFSHYHFYLSALRVNPWLVDRHCVVWFTHPKESDIGGEATVQALRNATVVTMCSKWRDFLLSLGLDAAQVKTVIGAADPDFFQPHQRGRGKVGFCSAYYERKDPDRIFNIVQGLSQFDFVLLGRNWEQYPRFPELLRMKNFEYREANYAEYPAFYDELDVFISPSRLEGGPIPLLESMMSNVVPVASDTGFAPDVIQHGTNGFLYSTEETDIDVIGQLVHQAMQSEANVRETVLQYSWDAYDKQYIHQLTAA